MAYLIARSTGNWTDAATWGVCNGTFFLDSQANNTALTTSYVGPATGQTPGAITIDGVAVKVATRAATPSGTMQVRVFNVTGGAAVAGTEVTINVADLPLNPVAAGVNFNQVSIGWVFFKFAAPVSLSAATSYRVEARTSVATQVNLFRDGTAGNWARLIRTTTTAAPGAGDSMFVVGEWTAAATKTDVVVTMNHNASTDFGGASTSLASLGIGKGGTLTWAATTTQLRLSGVLQKWMAGILHMGTPAAPTLGLLEFDCAANGDFGLVYYNEAADELQFAGTPPAIEETFCRLTADAAIAATALTVDRATGWASGDGIVIAGTQRSVAQAEARVLSGAAGASSLAITAGLTNFHAGSAADQAQAHVITRQRPFTFGVTGSATTYIRGAGSFTAAWTAFVLFGSDSTTKEAFGMVGNGRAIFTRCHFERARGLSFYANTGLTSWDWTFVGCTCWDMGTALASALVGASNTTGLATAVTMTDCVFINTGGTSRSFLSLGTLTSVRATLTDVAVSGFNGSELVRVSGAGHLLRVTRASIYNNNPTTSGAVTVAANGRLWLEDVLVWRNAGPGVAVTVNSAADGVRVSSWGNTTASMELSGGTESRWVDCLLAGETGFATVTGVVTNVGSGFLRAHFDGCRFGVAAGLRVAHSGGDLQPSVSTTPRFVFVNSLLASPNRWTAAPVFGAVVSEQRVGGATNVHQTEYVGIGTVAASATARSSPRSQALTPASADVKLASGPKRFPIRVGRRLTIGAYVRASGAYAGAAPRLILRANAAVGVPADVVLATHGGATDVWEPLDGQSALALEDGVLEAYVDCDGSAGVVYVDDWSAIST